MPFRLPSSSPALAALCLTLLFWCSALGQASAQKPLDDDRARAHFFAGESHFAAERWADAEREFSLAYELSGRPEMLINLSRAQERNGRLPEAISSLELLVGKHPENPYRGEAELRIAAMRKQLAEQKAVPIGPEPVVVAAAPPVAETLPEPSLEQEPAQSGKGIWPPSVLTMAVGGAAIASAVVSLATGLRAHHIYNDLDDRCPHARCDGSFQGDRDHGHTLARTSTGMMFVSLALAGGTAALWVYDVKKKRDQPSVAFGIDGTGARMRARF